MRACIIAIAASGTACGASSVVDEEPGPPPTASCPSARPGPEARGTWSRAAGLLDREDSERRTLQATCGLQESEPISFSSFDQNDGPATIGVHLQTLCLPFQVAYEEWRDSVYVWVRRSPVVDWTTVCGGNPDDGLGTYVITLSNDLGSRRVLPG